MEKRKRDDVSGGPRVHRPLDAHSRGLHVFFSPLFLPFRTPRIECAKEGMLPHTCYEVSIAMGGHWVLMQESLEVYGHLQIPEFPDIGCRS